MTKRNSRDLVGRNVTIVATTLPNTRTQAWAIPGRELTTSEIRARFALLALDMEWDRLNARFRNA